ncbi:MAG: hypothetical protein ACRD6N_18760 [Pyrinomonadaceae bacterium]
MNSLKKYIALPIGLSIIVVVSFAGSALGQSGSSKDADGTTTINSANTPAVEPRQSGSLSIGINTTNRDEPARKPFQTRGAINIPIGGSVASGFLPIPAGKRLVIENVSAVGRCPEGLRMELKYFTYFDNGDGVGDSNDITFHRIALTDQGTFQGTAVSTANHKVLVFADELIGTSHFQIGIQVNLSGIATQVAQGQITFSGFLEDLPAVQ